jgi:flagellar biosynthesis GTPase FlhF
MVNSLWDYTLKLLDGDTVTSHVLNFGTTKAELEDLCRTAEIPFSTRRKVERALRLAKHLSTPTQTAAKPPKQPKSMEMPPKSKAKRPREEDSDDDNVTSSEEAPKATKIPKKGSFEASREVASKKTSTKSKSSSSTATSSAASSSSSKHFTKMTRKQFRKRAAEFDPSLVNDSTACHVVAKANGGASVLYNYVMMNLALGLAIGNKHIQ